MSPMRYPRLLVDLGHLQIFCYQSDHEFTNNMPYKEVYWQKKGTPLVYGPFYSVGDATNHFTQLIIQERNLIRESQAAGDNVLWVDFRAKRRIK